MPQVVSGQGIGVSLPFGATADENSPVMQEFLLVVPVLLFSMVAHEVAHGYAALQQGDDTAYLLGRLTFNPLKHIDPWLTILMPMILWYGSGGQFLFGGVTARRLRRRSGYFQNYRGCLEPLAPNRFQGDKVRSGSYLHNRSAAIGRSG